MDGHHGGGPRPVVVVQIGWREPGLPIMGMHHVGHEGRNEAVADIGRDARQRGEPHAIVRPVDAVGRHVGVARPCVEMRHVEHEQIEAVMRGGEQTPWSAEIIRPAPDFVGSRQHPHHVGIARHQRAHLDAMRLQRDRQRARDIGEAAGLDDGIDFGGDREDANRRHVLSLSSIGWVMSEMPCSVVRKRLASNSGSSPTTSPSGISTPRSITTFFKRAPRPTLT